MLTTLIAFVVALGCLIVVHELGHYAVARWCGVKVLRFSVGFGRPVWRRVAGNDRTEWVVSAIPLGGYVKMLDEREGEVAPAERHRAFNTQPVRSRFAIVVAGPVANFLLAIGLYWVLFIHGVPGLKPVLGDVPPGTPAAVAGLAAGDRVSRVGDTPVATWQDLRWELLRAGVKRERVAIETTGSGGAVRSRELDLSALTAADLDGDFLKALGLALPAATASRRRYGG